MRFQVELKAWSKFGLAAIAINFFSSQAHSQISGSQARLAKCSEATIEEFYRPIYFKSEGRLKTADPNDFSNFVAKLEIKKTLSNDFTIKSMTDSCVQKALQYEIQNNMKLYCPLPTGRIACAAKLFVKEVQTLAGLSLSMVAMVSTPGLKPSPSEVVKSTMTIDLLNAMLILLEAVDSKQLSPSFSDSTSHERQELERLKQTELKIKDTIYSSIDMILPKLAEIKSGRRRTPISNGAYESWVDECLLRIEKRIAILRSKQQSLYANSHT